ncbi:capsule assembly Wzi family protein [Sandarakinorhabdus glacialis]|uniref:capsule assembly Wzi family protein n=1 Tax=Sandarakinorhabdus glacialis TaxID=1614636 RepID=UPI001FB0FE10|nr:capsule assembly Wzi family protein [Polymorphobacter glacialis]
MPAAAGPLALVGDVQLRQDVDLLKAAGLIDGPVDSWPLPWAQIDAGIDRAHDGRELDPYLKSAVSRLDRLGRLASKGVVVDARVSGTNNVSVARDFGTLARAKGDASASVEFNTDVVSVKLGGGLRTDQDGDAYNFEPSQAVVRLGNWAVYGGYTEQWFGPGQDGALLFSNSARPFPKIGIKRLMPDAIDFPVLRWLGPIRLDLFAGVMDEDRDFRNTVVVGTRLSFAPGRRWEIGLNRAQQLCGDGRPCGFSQILNSFIGFGNADNSTVGDTQAFLNQPGNQIAGFDISYTHRFGPVAAKFYVEAEAEDFDNVILEQYMRMIGTSVSGPWGSKGAVWTAKLEYSDTYATSLFNGTPLESLTGGQTRYPASAYNNVLYYTGFTYKNLPIGHWTDGDSRNLMFAGTLTDTRNRRWYASLRSVHLNVTNTGNPPWVVGGPGLPTHPISYRVSANSETFAILTAGAEVPTAYGDLRVEARYQTDSPNTPERREGRAAVEMSLRQRF